MCNDLSVFQIYFPFHTPLPMFLILEEFDSWLFQMSLKKYYSCDIMFLALVKSHPSHSLVFNVFYHIQDCIVQNYIFFSRSAFFFFVLFPSTFPSMILRQRQFICNIYPNKDVFLCRLLPVSYTHLDVYKRQLLYILKYIWCHFFGLFN